MDFQSLTRRELQALCKRNKIPANQTNAAMADALQALDIVEGGEEILNNRSEIESEQSHIDTPIAPRIGCRSSARRVPIKDDAVNSQILTRTRRGAKAVVGEAHENGKLDLPETPAGQISRMRAPIAPVRPKMETQLEIEMGDEKQDQLIQVEEKKDVLETPMASKAPRLRTTRSSARGGMESLVPVNHKVETSMSKVYSTRRSTRLLETKMMELSLNSNDEIEPAKLDDDGKDDVHPSKVEIPVVSSEEIEELKEDTQGIKTQNLELSMQIMDVEPEETKEIKDSVSETEVDGVSGQTLNAETEEVDTQGIKTQDLEFSIQIKVLEPEETEETKDAIVETEIDEVSGQTLNAERGEEVEMVEVIESEKSAEKLQENSEPFHQAMDVQAEKLEEIKEDTMEIKNVEVETEVLIVKENKDENEMETNEGTGVSIDLLEDQFYNSLNLGDEKKDASVKDYNHCSLRQLRKQCQEMTAIKEKKKASKEEVEKARPALQDLSENSVVIADNLV